MIHYFVDDNGMDIQEEDQPRGHFSKDINPNMFLSRKAAVKEAIKQIKQRIKYMQIQLVEYEKELEKCQIK